MMQYNKEKTVKIEKYIGVYNEMKTELRPNGMTTSYVYPRRILWTSSAPEAEVRNAECLLRNCDGQATLESRELCRMINRGARAGILLDFGFEMQGGVRILTHLLKGNVRIRFGESAMEAMSEIGEKGGATNDHAIRDLTCPLPFLGSATVGNTGFRFVRIDFLDEGADLDLREICAVFTYRDVEYQGTFECDDALLNEIFHTAAYTVHLNMQTYLWDGIKRDRLVWIGDMHPEISTVMNVFGSQDCVTRSLDLIRDNTPLPSVMNGIPAYTLWWILIQRDLYLYSGNSEYLAGQIGYLRDAVSYFSGLIDADGKNKIENNFLDWPSSVNEAGQKAGVHALMILAMDAASDIFRVLGKSDDAGFAALCAKKLRAAVYDPNGLKQAVALQVLAGQRDPDSAAELLTENGVHGYSTFLGYYILKALGEADRTEDALDAIREYWGTMLGLGATTFWEDFDIDWAENCSRLDEILPPDSDKKDIHGDFGGYCYKGYRHSLCHGWASGPAPFLMQYVLGVKPLEPGCRRLLVSPSLGNLKFARGTFPTPFGIVRIEHRKTDDGEVETSVDAPHGVEIVLG